MKKYADIRVEFTASFDDDGENDVTDQAHDAALDRMWPSLNGHEFNNIEIVGKVRDTEDE